MGNKQYIISFLATIQGQKIVVGGLRSIEAQTKRTGQSQTRLGQKTKTLGQNFMGLAARAMLVIPVWLLLRGLMMGLIRTIGDMVRANLDLEEGMARIKTVVAASSKSIDADMAGIKAKILDVAVKTRVPIKDLAEAFYFLRTANISTEEAMAAFEPTVNAMVGTMNSAKDTARAVAGIYNTMGESLEGVITPTEKFEKISDLLTFTYATQDVQLQELTSSYTKLAPYVSGLSDNFIELITMLGFLNTRLLRAGRTGRLTGRAILQMTKNAKKLADIVGITFDSDAPIDFLGTIEKVRDALKISGKLTAEQGQAIQDIFATRAGVTIRLLVEHFDDLKEMIKLATETAEGFGERMREIREETTRAQLGKMKNILAVLTNDFISAATGAGDFALVLKEINDNLVQNRSKWREAGTTIGWYIANLQAVEKTLGGTTDAFHTANLISQQQQRQMMSSSHTFLVLAGSVKVARLALERLFETEGISREEYEKETQDLKNKYEAEQKIQGTLEEQVEVNKKKDAIRRKTLKQIQTEIKSQIKLLKIAGASELDIARYKERMLEIEVESMTEQQEMIETRKRRLAVIEAEFGFQKKILDMQQKTQVNVMKTLGASELQILQIKQAQLNAVKDVIGATEYQLRLQDLQQQKQVALLNQKKQEWGLATSLFGQYIKGDKFEKQRLRRVIELTQLKEDELGQRYRTDMFDRSLIDEYFGNFSKKGQEAINVIRQEMFKFKDVEAPEELDFATQATSFGDTWETRMISAVNIFKPDFLNVADEFVQRFKEGVKLTPEDLRKEMELVTDETKREVTPEAIHTRRRELVEKIIEPKEFDYKGKGQWQRRTIVHEIKIGDETIKITGDISAELARKIAEETSKAIQSPETIKKIREDI